MTTASVQNASEAAKPPMLRELFVRRVEDLFRSQFEAQVVDLIGVGRVIRLTQISDVGTYGVERFAGPWDEKEARVAPVGVLALTEKSAGDVAALLVGDCMRWLSTAAGRVEMAEPPGVAASGEKFVWAVNARIQSKTAPV